MKSEIEKRLGCLIGLPLFKIGRSANLLWISFGNGFITTDKKGKERIIGEFAINIQTSWRITFDNSIIVGYRDIYLPSKLWTGDLNNFNWDIQGMNRCDERISELIMNKQTHDNIFVSSIEADEFGGFKTKFSNNYILEVFPDDTSDTEIWRFFSKESSELHFVVKANSYKS